MISQAMNRTGCYIDPLYDQHETGAGHPESPDRYTHTMNHLKGTDLKSKLKWRVADRATPEQIALCHEAGFVEKVESEISHDVFMLSTGDTNVSKDSFETALHAVGAGIDAVDLIAKGELDNAFCVTRPPGHHATPDVAMGFCIFNNIAIAAKHAQQAHGAERVLIIDWDVHHGNGTQDIFFEDPSVFFFSTHQSPWYPGSGKAPQIGRGAGKGTTLNCPFPAHAGRDDILPAFEQTLAERMKEFQPEWVFISAGFDSRKGDPLGLFELTDRDFIDLTKCAMDLAADYGKGRVVSMLEGGYNLEGLASAVEVHVDTLLHYRVNES